MSAWIDSLATGPLVALVIVYALFVWWFSTGLIIMLVRTRRTAHFWIMTAVSIVAILSLFGHQATLAKATPSGAFAGFTYAIAIWAWLEMSFLYGYVTGPRQGPLAAEAVGWPRFWYAFQTVSFHEIAILVAGAGLIALCWGAANQVGATIFLVLWAMRVSAKLNLFLGAPNVSAEFLPRHLAYLATYFQKRPASWFFPVSVTLASLTFGILVHAAITASDPFHTVAYALAATLLGLAILEHWFMVLPLPDGQLWRWALATGGKPRPSPGPLAQTINTVPPARARRAHLIQVQETPARSISVHDPRRSERVSAAHAGRQLKPSGGRSDR